MVFNEKDVQAADGTVTFSSGVQSEGEKEKSSSTLKTLPKTTKRILLTTSNLKNKNQMMRLIHQRQIQYLFRQLKSSANPKTKADDEPQEYGRGRRVDPKPKGIYKKMNGGLVAGIAQEELADDDNISKLWKFL